MSALAENSARKARAIFGIGCHGLCMSDSRRSSSCDSNTSPNTSMLSRDFKEFIESLNAHAVEYLIVGGYALAAHGHPRYTGDLDVWVNSQPGNVQRLMAALAAFGFGSLGLSAADFAAPDAVVQLGYPPGRIDLLTGIDGVQFEPCFARRQVVRVADLDLPIIHVDDFKTNKRATGRLKDLADLEALEGDPET